ncbi:MAG: hypothetical protein ACTSP1_09100 [Candidatus Freyarchaeota archaeon]|nr:hypothetical protein [Candidatus Freyarchaeota archaeon]
MLLVEDAHYGCGVHVCLCARLSGETGVTQVIVAVTHVYWAPETCKWEPSPNPYGCPVP